MKKLANKIVSFFVNSSEALEENRDIYEYGIIIVLSTLVNLIITLFIGLLLKIPYQLLAYLIPFILLRSSAGGYHAKTFWGCVAASSFIIIMVVLLVVYVKNSYYLPLMFLFDFVSIAIILGLAPVINPNRKVVPEYIYQLKRRSLFLVVLSFIVEFGFYLLDERIYMFSISIGILTASLTLLPSIAAKLK